VILHEPADTGDDGPATVSGEQATVAVREVDLRREKRFLICARSA